MWIWYLGIVIIISVLLIVLLSPVNDKTDEKFIDVRYHPIYQNQNTRESDAKIFPFDENLIFFPQYEFMKEYDEVVHLIYLRPSESYFVKHLSLEKNPNFAEWFPEWNELEILQYCKYVKSKTDLPVQLWVRRKSLQFTHPDWKEIEVMDFDAYLMFETFHPRSMIYYSALISKAKYVHYIQLGVEINEFIKRTNGKSTFITTNEDAVDPFWLQMDLQTEAFKNEIYKLAQMVEGGEDFMPEKKELIRISSSLKSKPIRKKGFEIGRGLQHDLNAYLHSEEWRLSHSTV